MHGFCMGCPSMLRGMGGYAFRGGRATMARGIFGAGSGFRVGWRTAAGGWFPLALGGGEAFILAGGLGTVLSFYVV